ncbi:MAG: heme ABC transporter permease [Pseudomonadota bacterium]|nr:heme ABC transporter permease [Pseudomonadota bacterium]
MHRFANPARFLRLSRALLPWYSGLFVVLMAAGLWLALVHSPPDYQQGESVRIMYVHVPAAWLSLLAYASLGAAGFCSLVWRHPLADVYIRATAPVGACFTLVCLATGSLWGRPMWNTWWVWQDTRLTSVLILFFLYLGVMALGRAFDNPERGGGAAALLSLVGLVNLPVIKFSVDWWNSLHQPASVLRLAGPALDPSMLLPLLVMAGAFLCLFILLSLMRTETALLERRAELLRLGVRP